MNRSIIPILIFYLFERTIFQGIVPVLPVLAQSLSTNNTQSSTYLTISYFSVFLGSLITDKVCATGISISKLALTISIPLCIALALIGIQTNLVALTITTAIAYFLLGMQINFITIMVSHLSTPQKAGRNFGILSNILLVGTVLGGFFIGPLIEKTGYKTGFVLLGIALLLSYLPLLFVKVPEKKNQSKTFDKKILSPTFLALLIVVGCSGMFTHAGRYLVVLVMSKQKYSLSQISYLFGFGTLMALPLPYLYGYLSNKVSNKKLLISTIIALFAAFALLTFSNSWSMFLIVIFLISVMLYCNRAVCNKICYELFPAEKQATAQSWLSTANWIAVLGGYFFMGVISDRFSYQQTSLISLAVILTVLLYTIFKLNVYPSNSISVVEEDMVMIEIDNK